MTHLIKWLGLTKFRVDGFGWVHRFGLKLTPLQLVTTVCKLRNKIGVQKVGGARKQFMSIQSWFQSNDRWGIVFGFYTSSKVFG